MRKQILFSALFIAGTAALNAQSVLSVDVSKNSTGSRVYADIVIEGEGAINTITLDLVYPSSLTYRSATIADGGLCMEYDEDADKDVETWVLNPGDFPAYSFTRLVAYGKTGKKVAANSDGKMFRVIFQPADQSVEYTASDFLFNNVSASLGGERECMKAPVCILSTNGYSSFSTSQDVIIEGATANYGTISGNELVLSPVAEGEPIFHGEGVILTGTEGTTVYATSVATATRPTSNDVIATGNGVEVAPRSVHVLSTEDGVTGFYVYTGTKIGAGKAYLTTTNGQRLIFREETGIESVTSDESLTSIYNLQGQMMTASQKGFQIVNGKKVIY